MVAYIRKHDLLRPGDRVGIAVSGGADSVALLRLMLELRDELGIVLSVVHLNHKLRGGDSDADEQFVLGLAGTYGLEVIAESRDVKAFSADKKLSLEAAAREARYEFFAKLALSHVDRIATAHTLDDQAETVLLKIMRGAGTRGLAGIYPKRAISRQPSAIRNTAISRQSSAISKDKPELEPASDLRNQTIIRPLLGSRRRDVRSYLAEIQQTWREDASNQDLRHTRNRVRQEILPLLERQVNPAVCATLAETAEIARAEEAYWNEEVDRVLPEVWIPAKSGGTLKLSSRLLPLALRRRLLRAGAENLGIALEFHHVEEILGNGSGKCNAVLSGEWRVKQHNDIITFGPVDRSMPEYEYELPVPGKVSITEAGIVLETSVLRGPDQSHHNDLVHSRFAREKWVVRNWRAGERFWLAHTKGPKKIKELLQDQHITGDEKQRWPVIACGDEIIWLRGLGVRRDIQANGAGVLIRETQSSDN